METLLLRILGSTGSHKISGGQLQLVERVIGGTYYGWGHMYLQAIRRQLNKSKTSGAGFCFGSFLCAFFFEKVPTLRLHRAVQDSGPWEPRMYRWCQMMIQEGGGRVGRFSTEELLEQWRQLPMVIEEYLYTSMDYQGDPDMARPPG